MRKLFVWASAADPEILRQCPGERIRYETMGAAILTTAAIATVSATFAVSMALGLRTPFAVVVGLFWGVAILNIDRLLIGGVHRRDTTAGNIAVAVPRVLLALLIGAVVSTPLVLRIFNSEINAQLDLDRQTALAQFTTKLNSDPRYVKIPDLERRIQELRQIINNGPTDTVEQNPTVTRLQLEYNALSTRYQQAERDVICENEGTCGSENVGKGPAYDEKVKARDRLRRELEAKKSELDAARATVAARQSSDNIRVRSNAEAELKTAQAELDDLTAKRKVEMDAYTANTLVDHGLLARLQALDHLKARNSTLGAAYLALLALLAALEMLPIIAKLIMSVGDLTVYDQIRKDTESAEYLVAVTASAERAQIALDASRARVDAERRQTVQQAQRICQAQQEVFDAVLDQWTRRELRKVEDDVDQFLEPREFSSSAPPDTTIVLVPQQQPPRTP
ncbi:MAG TPA: DUF4407 domain-containing protein [Kribbellaceae bacterium]|nr:DUF4407 domain-containing protein [Kribbellaceae bacterium]